MDFIIHVSTFIVDKGALLMVQEPSNENKGNLPGGHLEPGEKISDGAVREALEETGYEIELISLLGIYTGKGKDHYIHFVFNAEIVKERVVDDKSELLNMEWVNLEEIKDRDTLNASKLNSIIEAYRSGNSYPLSLINEMLEGQS